MPQKATVTRACASCSGAFLARVTDIQRGRGICCSRPCGSRHSARVRHALKPQTGENNPNFRGWSSKHPVVYVRRFKALNPEKVAAHYKLQRAVRAGLIVRPSTCEECGRFCKPDAHHDDYTKPLVVRWGCRRCHAQWDKARRHRPTLVKRSA